jgi:DNA invertase Pin-like site-specific DNA recombinase
MNQGTLSVKSRSVLDKGRREVYRKLIDYETTTLPEGTMNKAIGYVRVSTDGQVSEGITLEAQEAKIRAWCELQGYELAGVHIDAGISGNRADNRPALQEALAQCGKGCALVVYSLSRLARSTRDTLDIADRLAGAGADLVSLSERIDTTTAAGKMVFRMLAVLAEFERDQVSERTRFAMAHKKGNGERVGGVPYGLRLADDGVHLVPEENEQRAVSMAAALRLQGQSFRRIAAQLSAAGHQPRGGRAWHPQTVANMLRPQA